jgi:hypothetical protein
MPTKTPASDRVVAVQLKLSPDERDRLRVKAAQAGMQMSAYVRSIVLNDLAEAESRKQTTKTK